MPDSKTRRALRRKRDASQSSSSAALPAHAQLHDAAGSVLGGIALRGEEWVLVLQGRAVANTDSAGMAIAMLRHTVALLQRAGQDVAMRYSDTLRERATEEASAADHTLDDYLDFLEAERAGIQAERAGPPPTLQ